MLWLLPEPNPKSNSVHSSWVLLKSLFENVLLTVVLVVMVIEVLLIDLEEEEFSGKSKVTSYCVLSVELVGVGVETEVGFGVDSLLFFTNILVEIDEDVELGSMVEANIDEFGIGVEIPAEVEEYTFSLVGANVEDDLFNAG